MSHGSKIAQGMLVLALSLSLGAHWAVLKTAAWTGMLISYTRTDGIAQAISKTFDGEHPCALCHLVDRGQKSSDEKPAPLPPPSKGPELYLEKAAAFGFPDPRGRIRFPAADASAEPRPERPPVPPPRAG